MIKKLLRLRIKHLLKEYFQKAETIYRVGNGKAKLEYVVKILSKKMILPQEKDINLLREIIIEEFEVYKDEINQMIIREPIRI